MTTTTLTPVHVPRPFWHPGTDPLIRTVTDVEYDGDRLASYSYQEHSLDNLELGGARAEAAIACENHPYGGDFIIALRATRGTPTHA